MDSGDRWRFLRIPILVVACALLAESAAGLAGLLASPPWPMFVRLAVFAAAFVAFLSLRPGAARRGDRLRVARRRYAPRDPVTGLPDRRLLDEFWSRETGRAEHQGQVLGVALLEPGVAAGTPGPEALCAIGYALETSLRPDEMACRLETGELLVLVPSLSRDALQRRVAALAALASTVALDDRTRAPLLVATGWSEYPRDGRQIEDLLRMARARLHRARPDAASGGAEPHVGRCAPH